MAGPHDTRSTVDLGAMLHLRGQALEKGAPIALPLVSSSMYHLPGLPDGSAAYGRADNPTWEHLEHMLSHLEQAEAISFPSGMAAIAAALFATLKTGDRLLIPSDGYYVTRRLSDRFLSRLGVEIVERPTARFSEGGFEGFAVVYLETPSNPGLDMVDLATVAADVRAAGGITIADNTTMTPLGQRPLDLGIDIVVASDTKAMGGHSDLLMGHVASRRSDLIEAMREWRTFSGSIPGAQPAWLLHRGMETLDVRFDRMCTSAQILAERLSALQGAPKLRYPGLPDDSAYVLSQKQCLRHGFLMSLTFETEAKAEAFINTCALIRPATSFGGVHTSAERRARWGDAVPAGFVRLSVGVEPVEELWNAIYDALPD
ncbi:cystathionine gamma-lyase [Epibacterium ulvae]|uniref:cystathionine gamma-lyase n=1 Tax=Epibacterium ulvae TaxID=1156985 RepID=UPI00248FBF85|nr:cystathionine gamma-lyase [Epibacterium ulvae]